MPEDGRRLHTDVCARCRGGGVGGWLATMFGFGGSISGFDLHSFLVAVVGAIVVLGIFRLLRRA